jgi:hypothetical protein
VSRFDGTPLGTSADELLATNGPLHGPMMAVLHQSLGPPPPPL